MSSNIASSLLFNGFSIDKMTYIRNYDFQNDEEMDIDFGLSAEASMSEDRTHSMVVVNCKLFDEEFRDNTAPFYLDIDIRGFFNTESTDVEEFEFNALAILLPYIRSIITSFTAQAGIPPIILPPVNVYKVFNREPK
ncbi:protein-export chaperone SecB [Mesobacillus subterraneus]|uniref:protein-export chaperone SecB n=1 Tax=Mesobacillus subterraneus TaxID=285983 RepID=UPI00203D7F73|nr:protein-export chaperone SecB [Mesobacillus subterraneus]MCM3574739.1 protein-export chaperone SecB [Mesobacillus subterraneus]